MNSIPASALSAVTPGVLSAGGSPLALNAVFLTNDPSIPIGTVQPFPSPQAVGNWFGFSSPEYSRAQKYFAGFIGSSQTPGTLYFVQFNSAAVAGYLRSGSVAGLTLTALQALSGGLTLSLDGVSTVSAAINLAGATSFSNAAALIQTGIRAGAPGNTATVTYDALRAAFVVTSSTTGVNSAVSFATGTLSAGLLLTSATGAVLSQGAAIAVPAALMASIVNVQQNFATFMTVLEQTLSVKLAFTSWVQSTVDRFAYMVQDSDVTALQPNAAGSFGAIVNAAEDDGIVPIYDTSGGDLAAFSCGIAASINFSETNGRTVWAYRGQAGLTPQITDQTTYNNLVANGYSCYASFATANQQFQLFQNGQISGVWEWTDSYINQIFFNSQFQLAAVSLMAAMKSIPYVTRGYNLVRSAFLDPITQGLEFGAFVPGVPLSAAQAAQINSATGDKNAAVTIQNAGYYLKVSPATPQVRAARGSPPSAFYYTDGGSIQKIDLSSIDVQ